MGHASSPPLGRRAARRMRRFLNLTRRGGKPKGQVGGEEKSPSPARKAFLDETPPTDMDAKEEDIEKEDAEKKKKEQRVSFADGTKGPNWKGHDLVRRGRARGGRGQEKGAQDRGWGQEKWKGQTKWKDRNQWQWQPRSRRSGRGGGRR